MAYFYLHTLKFVLPVTVASGFFSSFIKPNFNPPKYDNNSVYLNQMERTIRYASWGFVIGVAYPIILPINMFIWKDN